MCAARRNKKILFTITWLIFSGQNKSLRFKNTTIERYLFIICNMRSFVKVDMLGRNCAMQM